MSSVSSVQNTDSVSQYYQYLEMLQEEQQSSGGSGSASGTDSVSISDAAMALLQMSSVGSTDSADSSDNLSQDPFSALMSGISQASQVSSFLKNTDDDQLKSILSSYQKDTGAIPGIDDPGVTDVNSLTPDQLAQARQALVAEQQAQEDAMAQQMGQYAQAISAYEQNILFE